MFREKCGYQKVSKYFLNIFSAYERENVLTVIKKEVNKDGEDKNDTEDKNRQFLELTVEIIGGLIIDAMKNSGFEVLFI